MKNIWIEEKESGQAIFELIVFMPFFIYMITVYFNIGDSINASINQQKAARGYHFFLLKGNSTAPSMSGITTFKNHDRDGGSMVVTGWQEKSDGQSALAPCFKFSSVFGGGDEQEKCDSVSEASDKSKFIKVFTVFGLCGANYMKGGKNDFYIRNVGPQSTLAPLQICSRQ